MSVIGVGPLPGIPKQPPHFSKTSVDDLSTLLAGRTVSEALQDAIREQDVQAVRKLVEIEMPPNDPTVASAVFTCFNQEIFGILHEAGVVALEQDTWHFLLPGIRNTMSVSSLPKKYTVRFCNFNDALFELLMQKQYSFPKEFGMALLSHKDGVNVINVAALKAVFAVQPWKLEESQQTETLKGYLSTLVEAYWQLHTVSNECCPNAHWPLHRIPQDNPNESRKDQIRASLLFWISQIPFTEVAKPIWDHGLLTHARSFVRCAIECQDKELLEAMLKAGAPVMVVDHDKAQQIAKTKNDSTSTEICKLVLRYLPRRSPPPHLPRAPHLPRVSFVNPENADD
ncbi:MAG: hypothetical protein KGQ49_02335 [Verrucomicrobia bacterium]|nr:hypothetical protein [Verrucomicrobiota bacterium]MBU6446219.1 hypothetical protein [Verrucomicrobiota bacterium]MDE3047148.1 hypothetical protein [Verrucomicrobiota bacterium]